MSNNYMQVIRDLTPAEICEHYNKIVAEKDKEIVRLQKDLSDWKSIAVEARQKLAELDGKKEE